MADGFSDLNSTILIQEKGSVGSNFEASITNYEEEPLKRQVDYTKIIGGLILPKTTTALSKEVGFDYVVDGVSFDNLVSSGNAIGSPSYDTFTQHKIVLQFTSGGDTYYKRYYDAYINEWDNSIESNVLRGKIRFTLPLKNINGNPTYLTGSDTTIGSSYDVTMGY